MPRWTSLPRPFLTAAAVVLAATATLYSVLWMYAARHQLASVELGFDPVYIATAHALRVSRIYPGSPAERAGLRDGDLIVATNGRHLDTMDPFNEIWWNAHPGDAVELTISRQGVPEPFVLRGTFRVRQASSQEGLALISLQQVLASYPVSFLLVGIPVLFLRREDANAWLLTLMFWGMIAAAPLPTLDSLPQVVRPFFHAWRAVFFGSLGAVFYIFFAVFPAA